MAPLPPGPLPDLSRISPGPRPFPALAPFATLCHLGASLGHFPALASFVHPALTAPRLLPQRRSAAAPSLRCRRTIGYDLKLTILEDVYLGSVLYEAFANRSLALFHLRNSNFEPSQRWPPLARATVLHRLKSPKRFHYVKNHSELTRSPPRMRSKCRGVREYFRGTRPPFCCARWTLCRMVA